ncbi:hypothetical protein [Frondihabitans cladoniiphilus]|uniref:Uncharacterized protein n=1 Tax=Frondihabitans cladoniiphilus TaxID=715785 RepID=A0ABP8W718_9MICO
MPSRYERDEHVPAVRIEHYRPPTRDYPLLPGNLERVLHMPPTLETPSRLNLAGDDISYQELIIRSMKPVGGDAIEQHAENHEAELG